MALHRYGYFRVEVFYFDSPCICAWQTLFSLTGWQHSTFLTLWLLSWKY